MTYMPLFLNKILILLLASCAAYPELKVPEIPTEHDQTVLAESSNRSLELQLLSSSEPNEYYVRLHSDLWEEGGDWTLLKRNMNDLGAKEIASSSQTSTAIAKLQKGGFLDFDVRPHEKLRYEIWQNGEMRKSIDYQVPFDLVVEGERWLKKEEIKAPRRIFIRPNSVLVFGNESRSWKVQELIASKGARIAAFLTKHQAAAGKRGKDTGNVELNIAKLQGSLIVDWQGQNGAHGKNGKNSTEQGIAGFKGRNGSWWRGGRVAGSYEPPVCHREPTNGLAGGPGGIGGDAGNGSSGGNTKTLRLVMQSKHPLSKITWNIRKSAAGKGGRGGLGGKGGVGGEPGKDGGICKKAHRGASGPRGPKGIDGRDGISGMILGSQCLKIASKTVQGSCGDL